jgi:hypothetical protein
MEDIALKQSRFKAWAVADLVGNENEVSIDAEDLEEAQAI